MKEKQLYRRIIKLFISLGYSQVEKEVQIFKTLRMGKRVDLLFTNHSKRAAVEVKIHDWETALFQAYVNSYFFDESYVALPEKVIEKINLELFKYYHVGVISIKKKIAEVILKSGESTWLS